VCQRSNGYSTNGRLQKCTVTVNSADYVRKSQSRRQKAHRTVNSDCLVPHRTIRWPHMSELQRSNPNCWVTWLAHRIVRCPHRQQPSPTAILVVGAINTPQPPHFKASKFSANTFNTRALDFTPRHKSKDQILSKSQTHSKDLVACERERHLCSFEFLSFGSLFFFPISCSQDICNQSKRHQLCGGPCGD
jgi:hypothetical protein